MILAVVGGKGGVGKTTVAYNLAAELDAVAVDADLGMADLPERRGPDLHDVLAGRAAAVEAVDESGPVDLLPCGRTLAGTRACDVRELSDALTAVDTHYDSVVVDCPAGLGTDAGVALLAADACVVVTTPDRVAVRDALRSRELARELDAGLSRVVLNVADEAPEDTRAAFGAPVVAVPDSRAVARAMAHGRPVRMLAPDAPATERFAALAAGVQRSTRS
ncbi:P-loop NTPase [Halorarius halobius]|uniref:P-loop NTPase n=1 Tax=Halorarius halobius TaxID=2962671 RepID=UPI0020CE817B|nr:P-loop NTPase [Halorarius halobius]